MVDYSVAQLADALKPYIVRWIPAAISGGGAEAGSIHDISGSLHNGTLALSQAPWALPVDGSRPITGNILVNSGITIDGVDISVHAANANAHHNQSHVLATTSGLGADHTVSGLTAGQYLRASSATAAAFSSILDGDLPATIVRTSRTLTAGNGLTGGGDLSADRALDVVVANTIQSGAGAGLSVEANAVRLTASYNPGAAAAVLATNSSGQTTIPLLVASTSVTAPQIGSASGDFSILAAADIVLNPTGGKISLGSGDLIKSSGTFTSGFAGSGWQIDDGILTPGAQTATFDDLIVRGRMSIYELLVQQIRATNGSIIVSAAGKLESATLISGSSYDCYVEGTSSDYAPFAVGDLLRAQRLRLGTSTVVWRSDLTVTAVSVGGNTRRFTATLRATTTVPAAGMEFVRIGSASDVSRQGSLYLTADDSGAPFMDIVNGITAHTDWNTAGKVKGRFGRLDGVTGNTNEYGIWAGTGTTDSDSQIVGSTTEVALKNVPLRFKSGSSVVMELAPGSSAPYMALGATLPTGPLTNNGVWFGKDGANYKWRVGTVSGGALTKGIFWDGADLIWKATNTSLDASGNLVAGPVTLSSTGVTSAATNDYANNAAYKFTSSGIVTSGVFAYATPTDTAIALTTNVWGGSLLIQDTNRNAYTRVGSYSISTKDATTILEAEARDALGATVEVARIVVNANGAQSLLSLSADTIQLSGSVEGHLLTSVASTYDIGTSGTPWRKIYVGEIVASTITGSVALAGNTWQRADAGDMYIKSSTDATSRTLYVSNPGTGSMHLDVEGNITLTGTVDGVDVSVFKTSYDSHTHDSRYYTETELSTGGSATVHWDNITGEPATYAPSSHGLDDAVHTGSLSWSKVSKTGSNLSDLATRAHSSLTGIGANDHHSQSHVLATNAGLGGDHTISGATAGYVLRASSATAAAFAQLAHSDLSGVGSNTHTQIDTHISTADTHVAHSGVTLTAGNGLTGGGTIAASRTFDVVVANTGATGLTVEADAVRLTSSSDPGIAAAVLASDASGNLTVRGLTVKGTRAVPSVLQLRSLTNDSSWADGDQLGAVEFYSEDGSNLGVGVKASIRAKQTGASTTGGFAGLVFSTTNTTGSNDTERMRISATGLVSIANDLTVSGKIGIGTVSPGRSLHVGTDGKVALYVSGITDNTGAGLYWSTDNDYSIRRSAEAWSGPNYAQLFVTWKTGIILDPGTLYGKSYVDVQGNGLMVTVGKLGVGTTAPSTKAEVVGDLTTTGFGHFKGWNVGGATGAGVDVGVTGGIGTILSYDRTGSVYIPMAIQTNETKQIYLPIDGNMGLFTTAMETWSTTFRAVQFGALGSIMTTPVWNSGASVHLVYNAYYNGAWKYQNSNPAASYLVGPAGHTWRTVSAGVADATITFSDKMLLDLSGNLTVAGDLYVDGGLVDFGTDYFEEGASYLDLKGAKPLQLDQTIQANGGGWSITKAGGATFGGNMAVGSTVFTVDVAGTRVGINRVPDQQFSLDVAGALRADWLVGKHAIQLENAAAIMHFDGPAPYRLDYTGTAATHMGKQPSVETRISYVVGKYGKAAQVCGIGTTNYITNPSFELNTTDYWTYYNSPTRALSPDALYGASALKMTTGATTNPYMYRTGSDLTLATGQTWTFSAWVKAGNYSAIGKSAVAWLRENGAGTTNTGTVVLTTEWQRVVVTRTLVEATPTSLNHYIVFNSTASSGDVLLVDGVQLEQKAYASSYCDGSLGDGHAWTGTAQASTSTRTAASAIKYEKLVNPRAFTVAGWFRSNIAENTTTHGVGSSWRNTFFQIGTYYTNPSAVLGMYSTATDVALYTKDTDDAGWTIAGTAILSTAFLANEWVFLALTYDGDKHYIYGYLPRTDAWTRYTGSSFPNNYGGGERLSLAVGAGQCDDLVDEIFVLDTAASESELMSIARSEAPVFAESSVAFFRSPSPAPIWVDEFGLWAKSASGNAILGVYAGDPLRVATSRAWGGIDLEDNDVLIGRSTNGYVHWDDSAQTLNVSGNITAQSGSITGALTLGSSGGIYQGSGTFASPTTGLKIWNDSGTGRIGGYNAGTLQWNAGTDGKLYAVGGTIGGWTLGSSNLTGSDITLGSSGQIDVGSGNSSVHMVSTSPSELFWAGHANYTSAPFRISPQGYFYTDGMTLMEVASTPVSPLTQDTMAQIYLKGDKLVIRFNNAGTTRYKYLDLTGTGVTWVHTTTAP